MLTIDDLEKLDREAAKRVDEIWSTITQQFLEPELQRQELEEYESLTPEEHGRILEEMGEENYQAWANEMERRKVKYGSNTGMD